MNDNDLHIDFNKLAAYLDGNLPSEEMAYMESLISSDIRLSEMIDEVSELDEQIIDNSYLDEMSFEDQLTDFSFSEIVNNPINENYSSFTDSSNELLASLYTDNLSNIEDGFTNLSDDGLDDSHDIMLSTEDEFTNGFDDSLDDSSENPIEDNLLDNL